MKKMLVRHGKLKKISLNLTIESACLRRKGEGKLTFELNSKGEKVVRRRDVQYDTSFHNRRTRHRKENIGRGEWSKEGEKVS